MAAVIQVKAPSYNNTVLSINTILGYTLLSLLLLTTATIPVFLISAKRKLFNPSPTFLKIYGSLFAEFKNDKGLLSSFYYPIFFWRRACYVLSIVMLENYVFLQVSINLAFSLLNLAFLIHFRPYVTRLTNFVSIFTEAGIFAVFAICASYQYDYNENNSIIIMWTAVGSIFTIMLVNIIDIVVQQIKWLVDVCKRWKARRILNNGIVKSMKPTVDQHIKGKNEMRPSTGVDSTLGDI